MDDKFFIVLTIYSISLIIILLISIHLHGKKKESLCLCPGSGINKECSPCRNTDMGGSEYVTGDVNTPKVGAPKQPKWPYDTLANGLTPQNRWRSCDTKCKGFLG